MCLILMYSRMPVAAAQPPVVTATTPVQNHVMQDNRTNEPAPKASPRTSLNYYYYYTEMLLNYSYLLINKILCIV